MVVNRKFVDLSSGKVFEVIDQFEDIAILDNRVKVKVNNLLNKNLYEEYIDPKDFFRNDNLVNTFTQQIKQLPLDDNYKRKLDDYDPDSQYRPSFSESAVLPYDPEQEKRELLEKAKKMYENENVSQSNIFEKFSGMIDEEDGLNQQIITKKSEERPDNQKNEIRQQKEFSENNIIPMDPIISMFKNVKRNTDFNISLEVNHKIPRLDFIEMMEDSYNTSIIEFLAEEFTNEILINPALIKNKISEEIRSLVYERNANEMAKEDSQTKTKTKKSQQENND